MAHLFFLRPFYVTSVVAKSLQEDLWHRLGQFTGFTAVTTLAGMAARCLWAVASNNPAGSLLDSPRDWLDMLQWTVGAGLLMANFHAAAADHPNDDKPFSFDVSLKVMAKLGQHQSPRWLRLIDAKAFYIIANLAPSALYLSILLASW